MANLPGIDPDNDGDVAASKAILTISADMHEDGLNGRGGVALFLPVS